MYMLFERELAILVGIDLPGAHLSAEVESIAELKRLSETAGATVVGQLIQKRDRPNLKYFIGSGKIEELKALVLAKEANLVIFDIELSGAQQRNLENYLEVKVIDRTELILDIFAQHAASREGSLQVELAQASFSLTRLVGHGSSMSRLGGGIGTRGPGETKLEQDRRKIRHKISSLKAEIKKLGRERTLRREKRRKSQLPLAALVGYTNSGKSTLLNSLTGAKVLTRDQLFATLDPTIRRFYLPSNQTILLTDTVGFIQKLPHQLVVAFHATLEEVTEADVLLHVVDGSHPYFEDQIRAVYNVLEELKAVTKPIITVFNKADKQTSPTPSHLIKKYAPAVSISALKKEGFDELTKSLDRLLAR
ncbi:MAG: GTPase HflX [bacterium]